MISELFNFGFSEEDTEKLSMALSQGTWGDLQSFIPEFAPHQVRQTQCQHWALNISAVGMWCLGQNPESLIASFESRLCLNKTIKLYFKAAL